MIYIYRLVQLIQLISLPPVFRAVKLFPSVLNDEAPRSQKSPGFGQKLNNMKQ
jgi:hypothetical protein